MKPVLVSGIQPSGRLHIGNYLGALKNFVELQNSGKYECYFFIADLHALTENPDPKELNKNILNLAADFLSAGLDPKKSVIFQQSQVKFVEELAGILTPFVPISELLRMTAFKEKILQKIKPRGGIAVSQDELDRTVEESNMGLVMYPVLMAADIFIYGAKFVPVGNDQDQHLELTRTLARKFNKRFGKTFVEPKALHAPTPRVMSLDDPTKKMSKSRPQGCIFIDDSPEEIKKKVSRAVTDSGKEIKFDPAKKPGLSNLLGVYAALKGVEPKDLEKEFSGKSYAEFKSELANIISNYFSNFREEKKKLMAKPDLLKKVLSAGSRQAASIAEKKLAEVKEKIGIAI